MESLLYKIGRPIVKLYFKLYNPRFYGIENIPKSGGVVLAGNHMSKFDPLLVASSTKRCIHFLGKKELCRGFGKVFFKMAGMIPVDRSKHNPEALKEAISALRSGYVVGIFPEGTVNKTKDIILPFKYGAVKMARDSGALILPFSITGKYTFLKKGVRITFGKPYKVVEDLEVENKKLENNVIELIKEGNKNGETY